MKTQSRNKKIPKTLQGILWSADIKNLDLKKNKVYIIHQVLMYGDLDEIAWLFRAYSKEEIRKIFETMPLKIYTPQIFNFVKNIILGLKGKSLPIQKYVATLY